MICSSVNLLRFISGPSPVVRIPAAHGGETRGHVNTCTARVRPAKSFDVGGFLGIGAKPVTLAVNKLNFMRDENGDVHATTSLTKERAKALPEHHH
jgi:hypothetical protein